MTPLEPFSKFNARLRVSPHPSPHGEYLLNEIRSHAQGFHHGSAPLIHPRLRSVFPLTLEKPPSPLTRTTGSHTETVIFFCENIFRRLNFPVSSLAVPASEVKSTRNEARTNASDEQNGLKARRVNAWRDKRRRSRVELEVGPTSSLDSIFPEFCLVCVSSSFEVSDYLFIHWRVVH